MNKTSLIILASIGLIGCVNGEFPPFQDSAPSVTQMQAQCFTDYDQFSKQAACIKDSLAQYPSTSQNPYAQEYMAYMQSLVAKVKQGKISGDDARLKLVSNLNELRERQQIEFQQQQEMANKRALLNLEYMKQTAPAPIEMYKMETHRPVNTNCSVIGNQVNCRSN